MTAGATMAVDPGAVSGAYAVRQPDGKVLVDDLPTVNGQVDGAAFAHLVRGYGISIAVVEQVGAMPKQGVASTFRFGVAVGIIRGVLIGNGVPVIYVVPGVWKKRFNLHGKDKEAARALATLRHPLVEGLHLKKHHGRAEALLMLDWYEQEKRP